jgi:hypothetical protein
MFYTPERVISSNVSFLTPVLVYVELSDSGFLLSRPL